MAKRVVDDASLTAVADAIRERAGTTEEMEFPNGFKSAVEEIPDPLLLALNSTLEEYTSAKLTTKIRDGAFSNLPSLKTVNFPNAIGVGSYAFQNCFGLRNVNLPRATYIGGAAFIYCQELTTISFNSLTDINNRAFESCKKLTALIIQNRTRVVNLASVGAFIDTPIASGTGYIYVHKTMADGSDGVAAYQAATNWSAFSIRAIEDYPEITRGAT